MRQIAEHLLKEYSTGLDYAGIKGKRLASRIQEIANIGITDNFGSCRIGFSAEERQAKELVKHWMSDAGLEVKEDHAGNVFGRLNGKQPSLPVIMSGSHLDTVPNGGHFDGVLGVLTALEVVEAWKATNVQPNRSFEVVIFSDEEGSRFNTGLTGSQAMMGYLNTLPEKDYEGKSFEEVLENNGLSGDTFFADKRDPSEIAVFVEVHIEQGKQLEKHDKPVGIVTGISGLFGLEICFSGQAGHAGNTPMGDRQDALVAASEFIFVNSTLPQKVSSSAVSTVGQVHVFPNGTNVIPGEVRLSVDIRDIDKNSLEQLAGLVIEEAIRISKAHHVKVKWEKTLDVAPVPVQARMQELQAKVLKEHNISPLYMPSGAGHDAMIMGKQLPIAMFFVRSKDGISHNPQEWTSLNDCVTAAHVLKRFVEKLEGAL